MFFSTIATSFLAASLVTAAPSVIKTSRSTTCTTIEQRKSWRDMTNDEKKAYIDADLCLMSLPAKMGFPGAQTRWDDLMFAHINSTNVVHDVGGFLPWHRLYMHTHLTMLKEECNYTGVQPYWEELLDVSNLTASPIFDTVYGFGGDGNGTDNCITDGPFANMTLHLGPVYEVTDHCLSRSLNENAILWANQTYLDTVMAATDYSEAWPLFSSWPHTAGHAAIGEVMLDITCSPGDPIFYLHHTNLDRLWWEWQSQNSSRLTDMTGQNVPTAEYIAQQGLYNVTDAWLDYDGDNGGNMTTLNHTLSVLGLLPNATVADVMDIQGGLLCYEYV
ncbi:hypothetical protein BGZ60DRAFT_527687 [Tricladium varicosporioides]|nr:hypothetical protein BGZ60DRAFT_527687 [Hymenoscyphus varicosporioides]